MIVTSSQKKTTKHNDTLGRQQHTIFNDKRDNFHMLSKSDTMTLYHRMRKDW